MSVVSILKLAIDLVSDDLRGLLNDLQVFVLDAPVLEQKLCLVLEIEELRQLHPLDLLQVIKLVLAKTMGDKLQLVNFVEDWQVLKGVEVGVKFVNCENTFVHTEGKLADRLQVSLLEVFKLVNAHELIFLVDTLLWSSDPCCRIGTTRLFTLHFVILVFLFLSCFYKSL